jgi:hypothetical protein
VGSSQVYLSHEPYVHGVCLHCTCRQPHTGAPDGLPARLSPPRSGSSSQAPVKGGASGRWYLA